MDTLSAVRALFPDVAAAVDQYQKTNPDRHTRNLARRLGNEEVLYHQFISRLLLLASAASIKSEKEPLGEIESKLGLQTAKNLRRDLHQMEECLRDLKADLTNTSRGSELLAKLRWQKTAFRGNRPRTPLQKRLDGVSRANKRIAAYLLHGHYQAPLALARDIQVSLNFRLSFRLRGLGQSTSFQVKGKRFVCDCDKAAGGITTHTSHQSPKSVSDIPPNDKDRDEDAFSLRHKSHHISISVRNLGQDRDIYSSVGISQKGDSESCPAKPDKDSKVLRLGIEETTLPPNAIGLDDLILHRRADLDQRGRMELAFRLSSAVLLLWGSLWVGDSANWRDWAVWFDSEQEDGIFSPYLSPKSPPGQESHDGKTPSSTTIFILAREPTLSLLGLCLIELAFGQTLAEVRRERVNLLSKEEEQNQDSIDLLTAKQLLALNYIGQRFGQDFEDVVNACLNQQYRERKGAGVRELDLLDQSFLERATVAILLPLYQELRKSSGCTCNATLPRGGQQPVSKNEYLQPVGNESHKGDDYLLPSISGNLSVGQSRDVDEVVENEAVQAPSTPSHDTQSRPSLATEDTSEGVHSSESHLPGQWPISVVSRDQFHDSHASEHAKPTQEPYSQNDDDNDDVASVCSHETVTVTTDSAFTWLSDHTEEPLDISEGHPLLLFQNVALRILLRAFRSWRTCGNGGNSSRNASSQFSYRGESSKKRRRAETEKNRGDEDDEDEEGESSRGVAGISSKKQRTKPENQTFACPFFKKNPLAYSNCSGYVLSRIRDVKQHLGRRHQMPMYCPRCNEVFRDEDGRDAHVRAAGCEERPPQKPEGITESQRKQLGKKAPASQSQEQQWFGIFDMLFPGHEPRPESAYIDSGLLQNVLAYQSFVSSNGPRILANILTARGAVTWHLPTGESDMQAFQHRMLEEGTRAIFDEWASTGGLAAPGPNTMNSTARGPGRSSQHEFTSPPGGVESSVDDDTDQQSMGDTSYFTSSYAPSSAHDSSSVSWTGQGEWFQGSQMDNMADNGFASMSFPPEMTVADTEEIAQLSRGFQNHNMGGTMDRLW